MGENVKILKLNRDSDKYKWEFVIEVCDYEVEDWLKVYEQRYPDDIFITDKG